MSEVTTTLEDNVSYLRVMLESPDVKSDDWQTSTGRLISLIALELLKKDISGEQYLLCLSALRRAQTTGVREAKKRTFSNSRFVDETPPLPSPSITGEDLKALVAQLSTIKSFWCNEWIAQLIVRSPDEKSLPAMLAKWSRKNHPDLESFLMRFIQDSLYAGQTEKRMTLIRESQKFLDERRSLDSGSVAESVSLFMEFIRATLKTNSSDSRITSLIFGLVTDYVAASQRQCPLLVLEPAFVSAIRSLHSQLEAPLQKHLKVFLTELASATASMARTLAGQSISSQGLLQKMTPLWLAAYPTFVQELDQSGLKKLMARHEDTSESTHAVDEITSSFARLLPAWINYKNGLTEPNEVDALDSMIRGAASNVGLEYFGEVNEVATYSPLTHHLSDTNGTIPSHVRIIRPGVHRLRSDGSALVVVAALVHPA